MVTQTVAFGHPGHGHAEYQHGVLHRVTSPFHVVTWLGGIALLTSGVIVIRRVLKQRQQQRIRATVHKH
jgi:hypothetical protein